MAWRMPEPVGSVIGSTVPMEIGAVFRGLVRFDGVECLEQPYRILREATRDEWIAEHPTRAPHPLHAKIVAYYLVSSD